MAQENGQENAQGHGQETTQRHAQQSATGEESLDFPREKLAYEAKRHTIGQEHIKALRQARHRTRKHIEQVQAYAEEHPEKCLAAANTYVRLALFCVKLISMEQELIDKLDPNLYRFKPEPHEEVDWEIIAQEIDKRRMQGIVSPPRADGLVFKRLPEATHPSYLPYDKPPPGTVNLYETVYGRVEELQELARQDALRQKEESERKRKEWHQKHGEGSWGW